MIDLWRGLHRLFGVRIDPVWAPFTWPDAACPLCGAHDGMYAVERGCDACLNTLKALQVTNASYGFDVVLERRDDGPDAV